MRTRKTRTITAAAGALALAAGLALTGCSTDVSVKPNSSGLEVENAYGSGAVSIVELPDGTRKVKCAVLIGYSKGGISCDWAGAR